MADLIDRQALVDEFKRLTLGENSLVERIFADGVYAVIETFPAVDAVEVVRCKDCKHWLKDFVGCTEHIGRCEWAGYAVGAPGYCVYGEKKADEREDWLAWAAWVVCPFCDLKRCIGRENCPELDAWIKERQEDDAI